MKGWNIYANVGLRLISQFKKQNLNKVYEYNVENEPLLLSYGSTYTAGQTGAINHPLCLKTIRSFGYRMEDTK